MAAATQLITIIFTLLLCRLVLNVDVPDITNFYQTYDIIWIVNTTMPTSVTCKFDYVNTTTANYTNFTRVSYTDGMMNREDLTGIFTKMDKLRPSATYNGMLVRSQDGTNKSFEELLHVYDNYTCGIFTVSPVMVVGNYYDIRVKKPSIQSISIECINKFEKLTRGATIETLYNESCKTRVQYG
uniref:Putative group i salivary lipocalin n=1 Tax=Rhipicephalus pulchellus TaxID=72859 RepID=L7LQH3_RHIPC